MGEWIIDAALGKESECEYICESTSLPTTGALVIHVDWIEKQLQSEGERERKGAKRKHEKLKESSN